MKLNLRSDKRRVFLNPANVAAIETLESGEEGCNVYTSGGTKFEVSQNPEDVAMAAALDGVGKPVKAAK